MGSGRGGRPQGHLWDSGWTRCHQLRQKHGKKASYPSHAVEKCESGNLVAVPQPSPPQAGENTGSWVVMLTVAWFVLIKRWSRLAHAVHSCAIWQGGRLSFLPSFLGCYLSLTTGTNRTLWFSFPFFFFFELPTAFLHNLQQWPAFESMGKSKLYAPRDTYLPCLDETISIQSIDKALGNSGSIRQRVFHSTFLFNH